MAKVLLINPNKWGRGITAIWIPSHVATLRSLGHDVQLFDCTFFKNWTVDEVTYNTQNKQYRPTDYHSRIRYSEEDVYTALQRKIDEFKPDLIFWSALSSHIHGEGEYVNIQYGYELVSRMKTSAKKVTAGLQVTAQPKEMFKRFPLADYFIGGESEFVLADFADHHDDPAALQKMRGLIWSDGRNVVVNPRQEIIAGMDSIPPYDYSLFEDQVFLRPYNGQVIKAVDYELSRGCIFTCSYCVETVLQRYYDVTQRSPLSGALSEGKKYLRSKSAKRIYEELEHLHREYQVELIRCQDTNFLTINRQVLKELADLLDEKPLPIKLYVETRADRMSSMDIELLRRLRVDGVGTGIELSSEAFRQNSLNRFAATERLIENFKLLRAAGIKRTTYNIIGLPKETEEMILDTIRFNRELQPDNVTVAFYSPYIGTDQAILGKEESYFDDYEYHVDGQLRSVSRSTLVDRPTLEFYKKYFTHFVTNGLDELAALKQSHGLAGNEKSNYRNVAAER